MESETLRSCPSVLAFLKVAEENEWEKAMQEGQNNLKKYSNLQQTFGKKTFDPKNCLKLEDFESIKGELNSRIAGSLKDYAIELDELIKSSEPIYHKMIDDIKSLSTDLETLSNTLSRIAEESGELFALHKKFNVSVKSHKWEKLQDLYAALNQHVVAWEKCLSNQVNSLQKHMLNTIELTVQEFDCFNEVWLNLQ
jgi:hypothetical protein